jgi:hypothetical protein
MRVINSVTTSQALPLFLTQLRPRGAQQDRKQDQRQNVADPPRIAPHNGQQQVAREKHLDQRGEGDALLFFCFDLEGLGGGLELFEQPGAGVFRNARAGLHQVHHHQPQRHADGHVHAEEQESAPRQRTELLQPAELHDTQRQGTEHQGHDHEE